jgi:antitoxin (DNA-binding transcriptional repressor) of toxin-antitoxin stability system
MITANMHETKTRLSELIRAVEEGNETVILCRHGQQVAEIRRIPRRRTALRDLTSDPRLRVELMPGYHPPELLSDEEWPAPDR